MSPRTVLIAAGGTGGHVYPALAVASFLIQQGMHVHWLGTRQGLEFRVVRENNIDLHTIRVVGLRGHGLLRLLAAPVLLLRAWCESLLLLRKLQPQVVLGMGGFVSGPVGIAAWCLRIPFCLHEQNAIAGMTNRLLRPFANTIMQAFPNTFPASNKVHTTGNPVRTEIVAAPTPAERMPQEKSEINVLILGGSLGALTLNQVVPQALALLSPEISLRITHQTGVKHLHTTRESYAQLRLAAEVNDYIENMARAYALADIVICRAGAMTIAELTAVGVGSVLIPFPYAVDDHQAANAKFLTDTGCAVMIRESELTADRLVTVLRELCSNYARLRTMAATCRQLARPEATETVARHCLEVACA